MPIPARVLVTGFVGLILCGSTACNMVPYQTYRQAQWQSMQAYQQAQAMRAERDSLAADRQRLESSLQAANQRLDNLSAERGKMHQKYISLLNRHKNQPSPLSRETTRRFEELARKYPQFEFDPTTGVSKFHSDILFSSGSADIKPEACHILREFADILNDNDARKLNILVVGHTDDKAISKEKTRRNHPTNWHLSTDRANSVVLELNKSGIKQSRMGSAGYSMYQPVADNKQGEGARKQNRRVEIFVLAPDAVVAGWDPNWSRH
ncbi:MAG: flagellar motor protein MotB [Planctomycetaceae bacterium]